MKELPSFMKNIGLMNEEQNGFRKGRSCQEHLFTLCNVITAKLQENESTYVAFVDMQKAFDWINRDLHYYKLQEYCISGRIFNAIKSLYKNSSTLVKIWVLCSNEFQVTMGVRQGDLESEIKSLNKGVEIGDVSVSILLYCMLMI